MNLKKNILKVFSANFMQLISSLVVGFFVPAILSIEGYADLKTYTLYISYIGFFHLGFLDGIYIKYGGKKLENIDKKQLKGEHNFFILFQLTVSAIVFLISIYCKSIILFLFSISILPIMVSSFHKYIYQATGEFSKYSKAIYIYTISYMLLNILLAIVFKNQDYRLYCLVTFASNLIVAILYETKFLINNRKIKGSIPKDVLKNIKVGFFILLGNLAVVSLYGIDKWFIKWFLTTEDFAYYSFAVSMLNLINTLINAISITFYNYLFDNNSKEKIMKLKKYLVILGGCASLGYFALSFIVSTFIQKYLPALQIIAITFSNFPYMILINALFVNLYKINKNEKKYFTSVVAILIVSIVYNIIGLAIFKNALAIAGATLLTLITWCIFSHIDLKNVYLDKKYIIYTSILTIGFLVSANLFNWLVGGIVYIAILIVSTLIIYKEVIFEVKDDINKIINKIIRGRQMKIKE